MTDQVDSVQAASADHLDMAPVVRQIESLRAAGSSVDVLEITGIQKLKYLQSFPRVRARVASVDLIHAHYGYCGWVARCQFAKPVVVSFMGDDLLGTPDADGRVGPLSRSVIRMNRWLARTVDAVIVKSVEMAKVIAPVKAHVVPNGVDLQAFQPMDPRKTRELLGWAEGKRYILFPGDPDNLRKGFPLARAAVANVSERIDEPLELVPLWRVAPGRVPLYMNSSSAMLMTSFIEGSPNVVKEALACNLPVVSVPVGDVSDLLAGIDGCAICPRDADSLGAALAKVLINAFRPAGRATLTQNRLDLDSIARKIMNIYEEVLTQNEAKRHPRY